jgi:hypothetical protein
MQSERRGLEADWRGLWQLWWETLDHIEGNGGAPWDRYALALFLDVAALGLRDLIPEVFGRDFAQGFDLTAEVRRTARQGIERIEQISGDLVDRRLPLESYTTEMVLLWEWKQGRARGEKTMAFVNRIRTLRDESRELELCDRAVADFIFRLARREEGTG